MLIYIHLLTKYPNQQLLDKIIKIQSIAKARYLKNKFKQTMNKIKSIQRQFRVYLKHKDLINKCIQIQKTWKMFVQRNKFKFTLKKIIFLQQYMITYLNISKIKYQYYDGTPAELLVFKRHINGQNYIFTQTQDNEYAVYKVFTPFIIYNNITNELLIINQHRNILCTVIFDKQYIHYQVADRVLTVENLLIYVACCGDSQFQFNVSFMNLSMYYGYDIHKWVISKYPYLIDKERIYKYNYTTKGVSYQFDENQIHNTNLFTVNQDQLKQKCCLESCKTWNIYDKSKQLFKQITLENDIQIERHHNILKEFPYYQLKQINYFNDHKLIKMDTYKQGILDEIQEYVSNTEYHISQFNKDLKLFKAYYINKKLVKHEKFEQNNLSNVINYYQDCEILQYFDIITGIQIYSEKRMITKKS